MSFSNLDIFSNLSIIKCAMMLDYSRDLKVIGNKNLLWINESQIFNCEKVESAKTVHLLDFFDFQKM